MYQKRIFAVLVVLAMLCSALYGCAQTEPAETTAGTEPVQTNPATETVSTQPTENTTQPTEA